MIIHIGFTGTRHGMSSEQHARLVLEIDRVVDIDDWFIAHHGDCVGADAEFHAIVRPLPNGQIVIHPGLSSDSLVMAGCLGDWNRPANTYLARNQDIVNESHVMFAAPPTNQMHEYGGTWRTIRMATAALKKGKLRELCVIGRSGQILDHSKW